MKLVRLTTENAEAEQWRLLSQFSYETNIRKKLEENGFDNLDESNIKLIAGSIRQGYEYFNAAKAAPLDISPLLLYFGATNLLVGASALITNRHMEIRHHGMQLLADEAGTLAEAMVQPRYAKRGGLQQFGNVFCPGINMVTGDTWTMGELLGSIPNLKSDFEQHYAELMYYVIPVDIIISNKIMFERMDNSELSRFDSPSAALKMIPDLPLAYLSPQFKSNHVILHYRRNGVEIGTHAISGKKFLQIAHTKSGHLINPSQLILQYMGLFILGSLSRYKPEMWNPFVGSDTTGELLIAEKFLSVCERFFPNLVLNQIKNERYQFVNETEGIINMTQSD